MARSYRVAAARGRPIGRRGSRLRFRACCARVSALLARWGIEADHVMTILNGADFDVFNPTAGDAQLTPPFERYCLFVGRLTPRISRSACAWRNFCSIEVRCG